jgi:uncharacterized membrane protein
VGHFAIAKKCARAYFSKKLIPKTSPNSIWAETSKLTIESSRTTGGIAAILLATGVVSQVVSLFQYMFGYQGAANLVVVGVSGILGILVFVGLIMFLVSMHGFSQDYGESHIFEYLVNGIIVTIVIGILTLIVALAVVISNASSLFPIFSSSAASQSQMSSSVWKSILPLLPVFSVVGLIWILFNVRSLNLLGDKSKVVLFRTGAKVLLAGAVLSVAVSATIAVIGSSMSISYNTVLPILSVPGGLVQDVAWVLLAMAFFRVQTSLAPSTAPTSVSTFLSAYGQAKYCPNCGTPIQASAVYCSKCGKKL